MYQLQSTDMLGFTDPTVILMLNMQLSFNVSCILVKEIWKGGSTLKWTLFYFCFYIDKYVCDLALLKF